MAEGKSSLFADSSALLDAIKAGAVKWNDRHDNDPRELFNILHDSPQLFTPAIWDELLTQIEKVQNWDDIENKAAVFARVLNDSHHESTTKPDFARLKRFLLAALERADDITANLPDEHHSGFENFSITLAGLAREDQRLIDEDYARAVANIITKISVPIEHCATGVGDSYGQNILWSAMVKIAIHQPEIFKKIDLTRPLQQRILHPKNLKEKAGLTHALACLIQQITERGGAPITVDPAIIEYAKEQTPETWHLADFTLETVKDVLTPDQKSFQARYSGGSDRSGYGTGQNTQYR